MSFPHTVGIIGGGTMGRGIAASIINNGITCILQDIAQSVLDAAADDLARARAKAVAAGRLTQDAADAAGALLTTSTDPAAFAGAALIIEAVTENEAVKRKVLSNVASIAPAAIIATNTSSYRVADLANVIPTPERFLGLHYFWPANVNRLLEVVAGPQTAAATLRIANEFAAATKKAALPCRDSFGFAINRYFVPYLNEAARLFDEGVAIDLIDFTARKIFGTPVGPFQLMNLSKPIIALHACQTLAQLGAFYEPAPGLIRLAESGANWTVDPKFSAADEPDPGIAERLLASVWYPALQLLDEDVATAADLDRGADIGLAWTTAKPCASMVAAGPAKLSAAIAKIIAQYGGRAPTSLSRIGALAAA